MKPKLAGNYVTRQGLEDEAECRNKQNRPSRVCERTQETKVSRDIVSGSSYFALMSGHGRIVRTLLRWLLFRTRVTRSQPKLQPRQLFGVGEDPVKLGLVASLAVSAGGTALSTTLPPVEMSAPRVVIVRATSIVLRRGPSTCRRRSVASYAISGCCD
jgi:hypothetical protein